MNLPRRTEERRQFGRRRSHVHGWICVEGRPRLPCLIRNFSEAGAYLEFENPSMVLRRFRLEIDAFGFSTPCEVRHHGPNSVGVRFLAEETGDEPQIIHTIDELMARAMATDSPTTESALAEVAERRRARG